MDALMNRFRAFAEGLVVMVCPVLLALALKKVNLTSEEHGSVIPVSILVVAAITLTAGVWPFLICCLSKRFWEPGARLPFGITKWLTILSSTCLVVLACLIIHLILTDNWVYPTIGVVFGLIIAIRSVCYFRAQDALQPDPMGNEEHHSKLENSLDFLSGVTALLFLGLESLALEGQSNGAQGIQHRLTAPMGTSFIACVLGVYLMIIETIPLVNRQDNVVDYGDTISYLTVIFDIIMAFAIAAAIFFIMYTLVKLQALLLIAPPFLILVTHAFHLAVNDDEESGVNGEESKTASLELTKVTFTGFLAVSIPTISSGSLNKYTDSFLLLAAAAVVSGLIWRLLTHTKSQTMVATASVASFCTHFCIAIATIPFTVMAGKALS